MTIAAAHQSLVATKNKISDVECGLVQYINDRLDQAIDLQEIIEANGQLSPKEYELLQQAQPSSADVERSFSKMNKMLADDRNFATQNVSKY